MKRLLLCTVLLVAMVPFVSAGDIAEENTHIALHPEGMANVTVERQYSTISSSQISYLVPERYNPVDLTAQDETGELDCSVRDFDFGTEIVCDPREYDDYTVKMQFFGEFVTQDRSGHTFSYVKQILTPTDRTSLTLTLPEGFGLVSSDTPYTPDDAEEGSDGRRISLQWSNDDVSTGETIQYSATYEELQVFDQIPSWILAGILLFLILSAGAAALYARDTDNGNGKKTIASIFPVLKDDEQLVVRYIIDQGGEVEQRDIVENVSYSKAKISKLLSDLEERNLVEKQKQGRVNIVKLAREVGDVAGLASVEDDETEVTAENT